MLRTEHLTQFAQISEGGVPLLTEEQRADFNQLELVMTKEFISNSSSISSACLDTNEEGAGSACCRSCRRCWLCLRLPPPWSPFSLRNSSPSYPMTTDAYKLWQKSSPM
ncbi:hypothetical protein KUCAC02_015879 [Chaenocephalus aceratus]|uniref:Uncharacterized protein n=1 Tax=Chaenocephalus aceratus TaxID=36190 RepID=A0ACB9Y147_CHAAC|nr:hypothetical protein KUCAC02_015879 [Chaenocephalus aceratus]